MFLFALSNGGLPHRNGGEAKFQCSACWCYFLGRKILHWLWGPRRVCISVITDREKITFSWLQWPCISGYQIFLISIFVTVQEWNLIPSLDFRIDILNGKSMCLSPFTFKWLSWKFRGCNTFPRWHYNMTNGHVDLQTEIKLHKPCGRGQGMWMWANVLKYLP